MHQSATFYRVTAIRIIVVFLLLTSAQTGSVNAQPDTLIVKARGEFDKANYPQAIEYLNQALAESPDNAEIHYYLGFFLHYLCYDSVPLTGFDRTKSDEVLSYLRKAIELDPKLGNAYYFLGAEYGGRARDAMRIGNAEEAIEQFRRARNAGAFPDWLLEYGRNELRSCEPDAILFVAGDAETNAVEYLQCVEKYRTDITAIPAALMERPWAIKMFRDGVEGCIRPAPMSWTDYQILDMHPYKWKQNPIRVPVPESIRQSANIEQISFEWEIDPDLGNGEELKYLSAGRAALSDILITNQWQRPIYFSMGCPLSKGLEQYIQTTGFVRQLLPYHVAGDIDIARTESLVLDEGNYTSLHTLIDNDMPRVSQLLQNYRFLFLSLAYQYAQSGDMDKARAVFTSMKTHLPENILPVTEPYKRNLELLEGMIK
ncbi:MAG: tetratricopeptide repeat protein [Candidatus Zixiibacteriota bacterium]|nr:MAG: tetratricopeptide repeat protein [candidate division Zixibacteria bacterium]